MSDSEKIHLLIALVDSHLAHQIISKIRAQFSQLPLEINLLDDGKRALADCENKMPDILIMASDLPGLTGQDLATALRKLDGSLPIIYLHTGNETPPEGVEAVRLPIVDWTELMARFQSSIPDAWKAKFGLFERNSALYKKLVDFGMRYQNQLEPASASSSSIVCIPDYFNETNDGISASTKVAFASEKTQKILVVKELTDAQHRRGLTTEVLILSTLTIATLILRLGNIEMGDGWFSLNRIAMTLTGISYFGFFLGRVFDRFLLSQSAKEQPSTSLSE